MGRHGSFRTPCGSTSSAKSDVFRRVLIAESRVLLLARRGHGRPLHRREPRRSRPDVPTSPGPGQESPTIAAASFVTGTLFASSVEGHWQTFVLWQHRQTFGVADPIYGKDVGYFVFSLPFERMVSALLLWLIVVAAGFAALVYRGTASGRLPATSRDL